MSIAELILGRPLASDETKAQQIGPIIGVAVLGLDALSSAAYGPEAALTAFLPTGAAALEFIIPITIAIVVLVLILFFSYRQTISAYPQGGGSYTVARENLGSLPGLIAAAGLSIDYMLNVAVAISAGTGALVSAVPALLPFTMPICLAILAILAIVNLRGVRESGFTFITPTYLFIGCMGLALTIGVVRGIAAHGQPVPVIRPPPAMISSAVGFWLVLRAFASGCSAMTGVEAVSNGIPIFKQPGERNAKITLGLIIIALVLMLLGIAFVAHYYHIAATPPGTAGYRSILSQIFDAVFGRNGLYYISISSVIMVLALSANTSFAGFPRVCRLLALDNFLPRAFSNPGRRLAYSEGIYILILVDALLIVIFKGITDRLIPLFALGAFLAFTCSQAGMVMHWWRKGGGPEAIYSMAINAAGAGCTLVALVILFISKFTEGAWLALLAVPILVMMFQRAKSYSQKVSRKVLLTTPISSGRLMRPAAIILLGALDRGAEKGVRLALGMGAETYALHVAADEENIEAFERQWKELVENPARAAKLHIPRLIILHSRFRELVPPILDFITSFRHSHPGRPIVVIIPQIIEPRWYHYIFRNTAMLLESNILWKGWPDVFVISTPMHLTE